MIAGTHILQEIFAIDILKALKFSLERIVGSMFCDYYDHNREIVRVKLVIAYCREINQN